MSNIVVDNPTIQTISLRGMFIQFVVNTSIGVGTLLIFGFLRPRNGNVYAPKQKYVSEKNKLPQIDKGLFSWIQPALKAPESLLIEKIGLDAVMFLRFISMCRNIFFWLFLLGFCVIVPINVCGTYQDQGGFPDTTNKIEYLSISFLRSQKWFSAHVIFTWVFSLIVYYYIYIQYNQYAELKHAYFKSHDYQKSLHSRTLLVLGAPPSIRSDQELGNYIESLELNCHISQACIGHNVGDLPKLVEEHDIAVRKLEEVLCKYFKDPNNIPPNRPTHSPGICHGPKVDSINYYTDKIQSLERKIYTARERVANKPNNYGFVSFHNVSDAHAVAKKYGGFNLGNLAVSKLTLAPWPRDIIWDNLPSVGAVKGTRKLIGYSLFIALCFFWLVPITFLSMTTQLTNIVRVVPGLAKIVENHWVLVALIESWMTPLLMTIFFVILPYILRQLSRFQGKHSKCSSERSTLAKLYLFFLINNIIIYTASTTIFDIVTKIKAILDKGDADIDDILHVFQNSNLFEQTANSVIRVSTFWINYISLRGAGTFIELAQFAALVIKKIKRFFITETPRNMKEFSRPPNFDYAVYYNLHLFFFTVGMMYSVIAPAILFFCLLYFELAYLTYRYVFTTKTETGGSFWRVVFNRMIVSIFFWQIVMIGTMNLKGVHFHSLTVIPLPIMTIFLKIMCSHSFDEKIQYYIPDSLSEKEELMNEDMESPNDKRDKVSIRFGHPALTTELIKPMLSSDVKNLLDKVYDGHLEMVEEEKRGRRVSSMMITNNGEKVIKIEAVDVKDLDIDEEYMKENELEYYENYEEKSPPSYVKEEQKNYPPKPSLQYYHQGERSPSPYQKQQPPSSQYSQQNVYFADSSSNNTPKQVETSSHQSPITTIQPQFVGDVGNEQEYIVEGEYEEEDVDNMEKHDGEQHVDRNQGV
ncbi:16083_t:CDS:2 [Acaulospora morrowiae]|uniref:16083_t:CDS:1 n=1 Tax=Acaulospora morrowiae TaxID=94023 RepID=A0A9N8WKT6_9GLOM|nr:16083_t:CDS:2 [Acaulospora morrowiae]